MRQIRTISEGGASHSISRFRDAHWNPQTDGIKTRACPPAGDLLGVGREFSLFAGLPLVEFPTLGRFLKHQ